MHDADVGADIVERVMARRGRYHIYDQIEAAKSALIVVDMQNAFCKPGAPGSTPVSNTPTIMPRPSRSLLALALMNAAAPVCSFGSSSGSRADMDRSCVCVPVCGDE